MEKYPLPRLDTDSELRKLLTKYCRLTKGEIWCDPISEHKIACIDSADSKAVVELMNGTEATLAIHDPPYNFIAFDELKEEQFINWSKKWIKNSFNSLALNSSIYIWLGADYKNHFQPFAGFIQMMKQSRFCIQKFYYFTKSTRIWNSPKLDVGQTGITLLFKGCSRFQC
jgi:site-specific DNA-methyltransferase (adenine-specific)